MVAVFLNVAKNVEVLEVGSQPPRTSFSASHISLSSFSANDVDSQPLPKTLTCLNDINFEGISVSSLFTPKANHYTLLQKLHASYGKNKDDLVKAKDALAKCKHYY
ncbi:hypothetical protein E4U37_005736 [Claviceps purpurea]|nr:hypothetical protein E4U37_005736 [Claviceps purpurea]KAG6303423.1 hypothetical protein E4U45_002209 [Claviceps purpurea]